jgi:hypothetical protein
MVDGLISLEVLQGSHIRHIFISDLFMFALFRRLSPTCSWYWSSILFNFKLFWFCAWEIRAGAHQAWVQEKLGKNFLVVFHLKLVKLNLLFSLLNFFFFAKEPNLESVYFFSDFGGTSILTNDRPYVFVVLLIDLNLSWSFLLYFLQLRLIKFTLFHLLL